MCLSDNIKINIINIILKNNGVTELINILTGTWNINKCE